MNTTERLEELLNQKDERIEELEQRLQKLEDNSERNWEWARHRLPETNENDLPVPRLELRHHKDSDSGYLTSWTYDLIYRHLLGHLVAVPLGHTTINGGGVENLFVRDILLPFRDGAHISSDSEHLGLPAFAIHGHRVVKLVKDGNALRQIPV